MFSKWREGESVNHYCDGTIDPWSLSWLWWRALGEAHAGPAVWPTTDGSWPCGTPPAMTECACAVCERDRPSERDGPSTVVVTEWEKPIWKKKKQKQHQKSQSDKSYAEDVLLVDRHYQRTPSEWTLRARQCVSLGQWGTSLRAPDRYRRYRVCPWVRLSKIQAHHVRGALNPSSTRCTTAISGRRSGRFEWLRHVRLAETVTAVRYVPSANVTDSQGISPAVLIEFSLSCSLRAPSLYRWAVQREAAFIDNCRAL